MMTPTVSVTRQGRDSCFPNLPPPLVVPLCQVSAMQIIDRLEVNRRGPYGGGIGHVSFTGSMDMALGLRTMVIPTTRDDTMYRYNRDPSAGGSTHSRKEWVVHIQVRRVRKE